MDMDKKRIKALKLHVANDDYFGTLATILDLMRQTGENTKNNTILKSLIDDLLYFQDGYEIKPKKCVQTPVSTAS